MNETGVFAAPCAICRKKVATQLCDFVYRYDRNPIFFRDYEMFKESVERGNDETCDLPLCKTCSHETDKADLCPHHHKLMQQAKLPHSLEIIRSREKAKILQQHFEGETKCPNH